jgi:hypothetical protein
MKTEQLLDELAAVVRVELNQHALDSMDENEQTPPLADSIAQALIEHLAPRMRKVSAALDHAKSWRPFGEALAMHFNDVMCPVEQAVDEFPEVWRK